MIAKDRVVWNHLQATSRIVNALLTKPEDERARGITQAAALGAIRDARTLQRTVEDWQLLAVKGARMADVPWAEIAAAADISRQAAWERWHEMTAPLEREAAPSSTKVGETFRVRAEVERTS